MSSISLRGAPVALLATVLLSAPASAAGAERLEVRAQGGAGTPVTGSGQLALSGTTAVRVGVPTLESGRAVLVEGPGATDPRAVRFPAYVATGRYARAVLRLTPTSGSALSPGSADFEFGAVLNLDRVSSGRSNDNGDNVLQRGLWGDRAQLKLEVDAGRPACSVKGDQGRRTVRSSVRLTRDAWYTVRCERMGGRLTVEVARYGASPVRTTVSGQTGRLSFDPARPASVGGKLDSSGQIVAGATDQLNGAVARVWVRHL